MDQIGGVKAKNQNIGSAHKLFRDSSGVVTRLLNECEIILIIDLVYQPGSRTNNPG